MSRRQVVAIGVFGLNTAYLAASNAASAFYFANIALHVALGGWLIAVLMIWLRRQPAVSWVLAAAAGLLAAGTLVGLAIAVVGAAAQFRWLLPIHIGVSALGVVALAFEAMRLVMTRGDGAPARPAAWAVTFSAAVLGTVLLARGGGAERARAAILNPATPPASMYEEGAGRNSPFFPSSADTNRHGIIPSEFFLTSETCGRCHREIYDEWQSSMHHFSSFNNQWYRKSIEYMQDTVGTQPSKWCAGCHDHAVFFNGRFDRPIKEQIQTPEAQAGLGCTSCHAITHVRSTMGQGDFEIAYPPLHDLAASDNPLLRFVHDQATYVDPAPHRATFLKPFHRAQSAEFCSACHKVHLDVPVNAYRWFRGFNDYDNWQASGVSGQGARSFYYPPQPQQCRDCHMPLVRSTDPAAKGGVVRSHRFAAANTAVPFVNQDDVQLKATQDFLQAGQVTIDVFAIARTQDTPRSSDAGPPQGVKGAEPREASTFAIGEESASFGPTQTFAMAAADVMAPLNAVPAAVRRGESVRVDVVVRTRRVGHFFPGGTVDAFDVWVELEAVDSRGRTLLHSGSVADEGRGPVDPAAHFYRALLLDEHGNPINKRNAWMARSVAYVRLIPPGAADTIHYRLHVPRDAGDSITITAKLKHRKFAWWNTQWAYAGIRDPAQGPYSIGPGHDDSRWVFTGDTSGVSGRLKEIPALPITTMSTASATVAVLASGAALPENAVLTNTATRERWNDYGIGLLLQGDTRNAEAAFLKVTQMDPRYADGWVNVGRVRLQEGDMAGAEQILRRALEVDPSLAKTHFFLAMALKSTGEYDQALKHLQIAAAKYPRDRVVLNQLGRVWFLKREFTRAVETLNRVLAIDPEDLQAHYNLMLCYRGLGDAASAERETKLYERFKADEAAQALTGPYRQLHPDDNNERQQIHEHGGPRPPSRETRSGVTSPKPQVAAGRGGSPAAKVSGSK